MPRLLCCHSRVLLALPVPPVPLLPLALLALVVLLALLALPALFATLALFALFCSVSADSFLARRAVRQLLWGRLSTRGARRQYADIGAVELLQFSCCSRCLRLFWKCSGSICRCMQHHMGMECSGHTWCKQVVI